MTEPTTAKTEPITRLPRVLVFDSGVGGLSILAEIRARVPRCELVYACDNGAFPYGTKGEEELVARVDWVLKALIRATAPDIVVVACNTASTVALPHVRAHFQNPVVGVVPAIKPAAKLTHSGVIGLLATPATVARPYTLQLIADFASHCTVHRLGSARLVQIAEDKLRGQASDLAEIRDIISPLFTDPALDTLVLACTHFPLLRAELEAAAPRPVQWVDSGEAIARRVLDLLPVANDPAHHLADPTGFDCWLTADGTDLAELEAGLARLGATGLRVLGG
ncbi:MAG: glutamate racemase [Pseudomonadota bacterium]|nr:glutamate racemase [Pseudomonadota bacterium]